MANDKREFYERMRDWSTQLFCFGRFIVLVGLNGNIWKLLVLSCNIGLLIFMFWWLVPNSQQTLIIGYEDRRKWFRIFYIGLTNVIFFSLKYFRFVDSITVTDTHTHIQSMANRSIFGGHSIHNRLPWTQTPWSSLESLWLAIFCEQCYNWHLFEYINIVNWLATI